MRFHLPIAALLCGLLLSPIAPVAGAAATPTVSSEAGTTTVTSTRVTLALRWGVRTKRQVGISVPAGVHCSTSRWRTTKVRRNTRVYTRLTLTCRHPADGTVRTVTVFRKDRKGQSVRVLLRGAPPVPATPTS